MKLRIKKRDQPIPRLEAFRLALLSPAALKPRKNATLKTFTLKNAKKTERIKVEKDDKLSRKSLVVIEKIPMVQGDDGIKKSKNRISKITKNRFNIFSRKKKAVLSTKQTPAKIDAKVEFDKLFVKLNRKVGDEGKENNQNKEDKENESFEEEINTSTDRIEDEEIEDQDTMSNIDEASGDDDKKIQCHFDPEEYSKLQNSSRYVLLKTSDLLDPSAGYISLEEEMKRPEKKLEIFRGVDTISFDDGVCTTGYLIIKPKTVKPFEQLFNKSLNFFVLEGEVILKSTSVKSHPDLNVDILVGKKLKRNDCAVIRKNSPFLLENWTEKDVILGVSIF